MKNYLKVALILFLICAVSALFLGVINHITAPVIAENIQKETLSALEQVSGGLEIGSERAGEGNINYVIPLSEGGVIKGYILSLSATGYGGTMTIVASYYSDGSLISAKMMGNSETPGLGKKAEEGWYMLQFVGLGGDKSLPKSKNDLADPSAVSGASVTFNGVTKALTAGSEYVKSLGGK